MKTDMEIIDWFRASTTYINAHRGKIFVVFISGEAQQHENFRNIVFDLSLLHSLGVRMVLVQGARPQISKALEAQGVKSLYHDDLRVTEASSMATIMATVGQLGTQLEAMLSMGVRNSPMFGSKLTLCRGNFVTGKPMGVLEGINYQYTGKVRKIQTNAILSQLMDGNIVLLSNLGVSVTGEIFNLSAEEVATEAALALSAKKLILLVPTPGVMNSAGELVASMTATDAKAHAKELSQRGDAESQCVFRALQAALRVTAKSIPRSHLISFKENGALLLELYSREGRGSLLGQDSLDELRAATLADISGILNLIRPLEESGILVKRSRELLETEIDNFRVIALEGTIIGCAALYPTGNSLGEVACIAIHENYRNRGLGRRMLEALERTALESNMTALFTLTTEASHFFLENSYCEVTLNELPEQRKQLYNYHRGSRVLKKLLMHN